MDGTDEPPTPNAEQERVGDFVHGSLMQNITLADRKAGILFTLVSAALLFLFTRVPPVFDSPSGLLWLAVVILLVAAAATAFLVIFPRIRKDAGSVLFWDSVARLPDRKAYISAVCRQRSSDLARGKLAYCYDLSCICQRKFRLLRIAMINTAVGLMLFLLALAVGLPNAGAPPLALH